MMLATLDIPAEYTAEYNRWYDLDHMPEHVAKPDVLAGRRYVAPRGLRAVPGAVRCELLGGYPPYLTTYLFGGPLDMRDAAAREGWLALDRTLLRSGRFWRLGQASYHGLWTVASALARPGCLVRPAAVPYLAHQGVIVALGRAAAPERVPEAVEWWERVHFPDLATVPGLLAAVRLEPTEDDSDLVLHLLLCDGDPETVARGIEAAKAYWRPVGRFPAHGGVYRELAFLPYRRLIPFEYDFDIGEDDSPGGDGSDSDGAD
jgi:hypothetical protein